jgi:hypothetical protein
MRMLWFLPMGVLIGLAGSRTAIRARHGVKGRPLDASWALMLFLGWLPLACWILAQVVGQY